MAVTKDDVNLYISLITFVCFTRVLVFKFSAHLTTDDDDDDDGFESNRIGSDRTRGDRLVSFASLVAHGEFGFGEGFTYESIESKSKSVSSCLSVCR